MRNMIQCFASLAAVAVLATMVPIVPSAAEPVQSNDSFDASMVFATETRLNVYVDGQWSDTLSDSYGFGDTVTITAPSTSGGKSFAYWQADGSAISYNKTLKLTMNAHTTLYAVYANSTTSKPTAGFTSITRTNDGSKISFQAIASGDTAGIVYSTTATGSNLKIGGTGVINVAAEKLTDSTQTMPKSVLDKNNCWMLQIKPDSATKVYHARAYVTIGETTTYGDVKNVKLSDLKNGVSMVANLDGFDPEGSLQDALAGLASDIKTVTFDANGGTGTMASQAVLSSADTKLNANTFTRSGYTFSGWNTKANGSGTSYSNGQSVTLSDNTTLYAQWKSTQPTYYSQSWTLTMDSYEYDGTAHEPIINGRAYTYSSTQVQYTYYNADTNEKLDGAPSAIGNYKVKVYADGGSNYYSRTQYATYSITDPIDANGMAKVDAFKENDTVPVSDGKIFAGWFTDETCTTAYTEDTGKAYAKFIDENILTVKAQISSGTTVNSASTSIRFITSVDSLKYQNVGFKITFNGKTIDKQMTKVYTALNANGKKISPKVFSEDSNYMEAYTLNNVPQSAFGKEFTVTPYYTTQDGTIVEGKTNTFTIANMIK